MKQVLTKHQLYSWVWSIHSCCWKFMHVGHLVYSTEHNTSCLHSLTMWQHNTSAVNHMVSLPRPPPRCNVVNDQQLEVWKAWECDLVFTMTVIHFLLKRWTLSGGKLGKKRKEGNICSCTSKSGFWCNSDLNQLHIYNTSCLSSWGYIAYVT